MAVKNNGGVKKNLIVAVDLGGTNLKVALVNKRFKIVDRLYINTSGFNSKEDLIRGIVSAVKGIVYNNKLSLMGISGLGVGLPGPVDNITGRVHFLPNISGWKDVLLKGILEKRLGIPVFIDNDAKLMCLAEHTIGAAKGKHNAICITLGTGVGGGIIIGGRLYRGPDNAAGELGHLPINEFGPLCNCGGRGCLEAYVGNKRIINSARKIFPDFTTLEALSDSANRGNKKAISFWSQIGQHIGSALTGLVNILNPECIVIGGGVSCAGRILFDPIKKVVKNRSMPVQAKRVSIIKAKLSKDAGLIGAAILVRENI